MIYAKVDEQTYGDARGEEGETWYMASPRNFGESSIDAEREREREREREKERKGEGRRRERKIKRLHHRNLTLGRTQRRIFRDAKIKARVLQVCMRMCIKELTLSCANKLHLHLHYHTNELDNAFTLTHLYY